MKLGEFDKDDWRYVLKQVVGLIFEDINPQLYHDSISTMLEVDFVESLQSMMFDFNNHGWASTIPSRFNFYHVLVREDCI